MSVNRRRQRSVRITVAVGLLATATVVVAVALLAGGAARLGLAALVAWGAGIAASRIFSNELAVSRRVHARDRAEQAQAYSDLQKERVAEHTRFATLMEQKVEDHATTIRRLQTTLRSAEKRAEFAEETASRNKIAVAKAHREIAALKARIAELEASAAPEAPEAPEEQPVALPASSQEPDEPECDLATLAEATSVGEAPTVVDLLAWEVTGPAVSDPAPQRRRQAGA